MSSDFDALRIRKVLSERQNSVYAKQKDVQQGVTDYISTAYPTKRANKIFEFIGLDKTHGRKIIKIVVYGDCLQATCGNAELAQLESS